MITLGVSFFHNKENRPGIPRRKKRFSSLNCNVFLGATFAFATDSRRKSIEHYLSFLEERKDAITEYDVRLWHGMVEFVTIYSKDGIRFTMKDETEIMA